MYLAWVRLSRGTELFNELRYHFSAFVCVCVCASVCTVTVVLLVLLVVLVVLPAYYRDSTSTTGTTVVR